MLKRKILNSAPTLRAHIQNENKNDQRFITENKLNKTFKRCKKKKDDRVFTNTFYEDDITLMRKLDKGITIKENDRSIDTKFLTKF